jgi:tetratricopeptide (TPR) repeat protein
MNVEQLLKAGIRSAKSGDTLHAQKLFAQAAKIDPESELAWLSLGHVLTDPDKKRDCFHRVLQINPHNPSAKRALGTHAASPRTPAAFEAETGGSGVGSDGIGSTPTYDEPMDPPQKKSSIPISLVIGTGVILSSVVLLFLIFVGRFTSLGDQLRGLLSLSRSEVPASPAATLPPNWTDTPIPPSPTLKPPTATSEPTPTPLYEYRLTAAQPLIYAAFESNKQWDCPASIKAWTEVIELLPEHGPAYYWRAFQAHCQSRAQGDISKYRTSLYDMLEDINLAIALDPDATGDYYALRFAIYAELASTYETRVDNDLFNALATDDLETALYLGAGDPLLPRTYALQLAYTDRCDEALIQANRLQDSILPGEAPSAGVLTMLADAYVCNGQYWQALNAINSAINIKDHEDRRYTRAMINYGLGRLESALADLDEIIEQYPTYKGHRYHLRALVHYDLGYTDAAIEDLQLGYYNSWGYGCAAALVEGLLELQEDDLAAATEFLRYSEATCFPQSRPVWTRVLRELEKLNVDPVKGSPSVELLPTPTAIFAPIDQTQDILPRPPAVERTYDGGTGRMRLSNQGHITMHFAPRILLSVDQVLSLTLELEPELLPEEPNIYLYLLNPTERIWSMFPWEGETIQVSHPDRFIYPEGSLYLSTYVFANEHTTIKNVAVGLELITDAGRRLNMLDAEPTTNPLPAVLAYATPMTYSRSTPFTVNGQNSVLLKLSPEPSIPIIDFVITLTFHFSVKGEGQSTLDFSLWSPTSGGWGINQGNNKIAFGKSVIQINIPDPYVSRTGEIYLSIRNYGSVSIEITEISAAIEARTVDGQIVQHGVIR